MAFCDAYLGMNSGLENLNTRRIVSEGKCEVRYFLSSEGSLSAIDVLIPRAAEKIEVVLFLYGKN